ncbi:hypothetical protein RIF29_41908 [Crotalaria pallida]|uniref:Uncharacterized protein n=1 Tax=Crotalaria pallida TaxID=3830 RepID=A0AAN9E874_CROPI
MRGKITAANPTPREGFPTPTTPPLPPTVSHGGLCLAPLQNPARPSFSFLNSLSLSLSLLCPDPFLQPKGVFNSLQSLS